MFSATTTQLAEFHNDPDMSREVNPEGHVQLESCDLKFIVYADVMNEYQFSGVDISGFIEDVIAHTKEGYTIYHFGSEDILLVVAFRASELTITEE